MRDALLGTSWAERALTMLVAAATLGLLLAFPAWRMEDIPPAYALEPVEVLERVQDFAALHATGTEIDGMPLVAPPPGDVPVLARRYEFWPALELAAGQTYRLHASSLDGIHSMVLDGQELLLVPGEVRVLEITPRSPGRLDIRCNEYCGLGHNKMRGIITVK